MREPCAALCAAPAASRSSRTKCSARRTSSKGKASGVRRRDGSEWICPHCGEIAEFCECAHAECGCVVGDVFDEFDADPFDEIIVSIDEVGGLTPTVNGYVNVEPA